jgi:uncharacterized protein (TIGR03437 family)
MGNTSISVNGRTAPLLFLSPLQINAQMPWETETGPATVVITRSGVSTCRTVTVATAGPGIFSAVGNRAAALNEDGSRNTDYPVPAGQFIILFGTGLGPVSPALASGEAAPTLPLSHAPGAVTVEINGQPVTPDFCGLAPGYAGLWQLNVRVPESTPAGTVPVVIVVDGVRSEAATIQVR